MPTANINLALVKDFNLSDSALFMYATIDAYCVQPTKERAYINVKELSQILFNGKNRFVPLARGLNELAEHKLIIKNQRNSYDIRPLIDYKPKRIIQVDMEQIASLGDEKKVASSLLKTYLIMKNELVSANKDILALTKSQLAELVNCHTKSITNRLELMKKYGILKVKDFTEESSKWGLSFDMIWYTTPEHEKELNQITTSLTSIIEKGVRPCAA